MLRALFFAAAIAASSCAAAEPARFAVSAEAVAPDPGPFTTTIGSIGAGAKLVSAGGGFEPVVFRNHYEIRQDAADRLIIDPRQLTFYDTIREGAFDGAEVQIWRLENGALRRVRADRVRRGGHLASGWRGASPGKRMIPVEKPGYVYAFAPWNRPGAETWFAVRAVGADGAVSAPSEAVRIRAPETSSRIEPDNTLIDAPEPVGDGAAPPPPLDLAATLARDGSVHLTWRSGGAGTAGYVIVSSETAPEKHRGYALLLEGDGEPVLRGDMAVISKKFYEGSRRRNNTNRVWNATGETTLFRPQLIDAWSDEDEGVRWRLVPHEPNTPVEEPGETYLEAHIGPKRMLTVGITNHAGVDQDWYPVLQTRPYRVSFWMRADHATRVRFVFTGPYASRIRPVVFDIGTRWRRYETDVTPLRTAKGSEPGRMVLELYGEARIDLDNLRIHPADTPYLSWEAEDRERLRRSGMSMLRTHGLIKTGMRTYDLAQLTNPGGAISGVRGLNTLPQTLRAIADVGMDPWLQIEPHLSPEEWLGLLEYLAAPFDPAVDDPAKRPWAAKRAGQGRVAPWTDAFDTILVELGNETWNGLFAPWTYGPMREAGSGRMASAGEVYGLSTQYVIDLWRGSPWWNADLERRVAFVIGGQAAVPDYGRRAATAAPGARWLTIAAYNGGWDEGEGPPSGDIDSFARLLGHAPQVIAPRAEALEEVGARAASARSAPVALGTYEAGPGYALNGLNGARVTAEQVEVQARVMKSQAAGVATLDAFLTMAQQGFGLQNYFIYGTGSYWSSHLDWRGGGAENPAWLLLGAINREVIGTPLAVRDLGGPTIALPARGRAPAMRIPGIAVYAFHRDDGRLAVVVLSRRTPASGDDGYTPVTLSLPFRQAGRVALLRMAGPYDANAASGPGPTIETVMLAPPTDPSSVRLDEKMGLTSRGIPPGSVAIYLFDDPGA